MTKSEDSTRSSSPGENLAEAHGAANAFLRGDLTFKKPIL